MRALTDPTLFDGIGIAYSDEILHRARLSRSSGELDRATNGMLAPTRRARQEMIEGFVIVDDAAQDDAGIEVPKIVVTVEAKENGNSSAWDGQDRGLEHLPACRLRHLASRDGVRGA
jgi:hypothetical protein